MNAVVSVSGQAPAIQISNFEQLMRFGQMAAKSGMVPQGYINKPEAVIIAVQMGSELGLAPMQSLQNIAVINGRPSVWGDALLGLVKASSVCDDVVETVEGDGDRMVAICTAKRRGKAPVESRFSVEDAKAAGLWSKQGPWKQYPRRMLQMRARGFALRDAFPDVLRGLITAEEAADTPTDTYRSSVQQNTIDITPTPERQEPRQPDYVRLFAAQAEKCRTTQEAGALRKRWTGGIDKTAAEGNPIPQNVQDHVYQIINDRFEELAEQEQAEADAKAEQPLEEMPS